MGSSKEDEAFSLPSYDEATAGQGPFVEHPVEFHVYRQGGWGSARNNVVTGPDKQKIIMHFDFPNTWSGKWDSTLRREGPGGEVVARITKRSGYESFTVIMASDGRENKCEYHGFLKPRYDFLGGESGTVEYTWKPDGSWKHSADYSLYKKADLDGKRKDACEVLAHWRTTIWAKSKGGVLLIQPSHAYEQDLILATALGVEERAREHRENRG